MTKIILLAILLYKLLSPIYHKLGKAIFGENFGCRFYPTCSDYARQSLKKHGIVRGSVLSIWRFLRCNPFFPGGNDPVPDKI
jgi:uncharacterized protein